MKKRSSVTVLIGAVLLAAVFVPHQVNPSALVDVPGYRVKGAAKPVVVITEYSDFQCPSCSRAQTYLMEIVREHQTGVAVVFRHYPLRMHRWAFLAAQAAESAGAQGKFWEYHNILFEHQSEWDKSEDARALFVHYAESLGLDIERFGRDLDEGRWNAAIIRDIEEAKSKNVNVTPTFFINERRLVGDSQLREYGRRYVELEKTR